MTTARGADPPPESAGAETRRQSVERGPFKTAGSPTAEWRRQAGRVAGRPSARDARPHNARAPSRDGRPADDAPIAPARGVIEIVSGACWRASYLAPRGGRLSARVSTRPVIMFIVIQMPPGGRQIGSIIRAAALYCNFQRRGRMDERGVVFLG